MDGNTQKLGFWSPIGWRVTARCLLGLSLFLEALLVFVSSRPLLLSGSWDFEMVMVLLLINWPSLVKLVGFWDFLKLF